MHFRHASKVARLEEDVQVMTIQFEKRLADLRAKSGEPTGALAESHCNPTSFPPFSHWCAHIFKYNNYWSGQEWSTHWRTA